MLKKLESTIHDNTDLNNIGLDKVITSCNRYKERKTCKKEIGKLCLSQGIHWDNRIGVYLNMKIYRIV